MRVLIVHNSYQQAGGEDSVVANQHALLEAHGCDTRLWTVSNDAITGGAGTDVCIGGPGTDTFVTCETTVQ